MSYLKLTKPELSGKQVWNQEMSWFKRKYPKKA